MARKKRKIKNSAADRKKQKKKPAAQLGDESPRPIRWKSGPHKKQKKNRAREKKAQKRNNQAAHSTAWVLDFRPDREKKTQKRKDQAAHSTTWVMDFRADRGKGKRQGLALYVSANLTAKKWMVGYVTGSY
jgi:hypothetical protein